MKNLLKFLSFVGAFLLLEGIYSKNKKTKPVLKHRELVTFDSTPLYSREKKVLFKDNILELFLLAVLFVFVYSGIQQYSNYLKSSIFDFKNVEFDGTEFPIKKVPNWVSLSDAERKFSFDKIPSHKIISIPEYKISDFQEGKVWRADNEKQRNAYITYPVPNLGNYKLDGQEGVGSHPGIDIKTPIGTPVNSFANGIVTKVEYQKTGFGKFILIAHPNTPNPKNSQEKITIYSAYAHLSQQLVKEGDLVKKGQLIGKSGNTGMATAPHLHFQVESEDAPFHPYWPFTWNELNSAGITSYFGAVNSGFNKSKAKKYTFHPIELGEFSRNYMASAIIQKEEPEIIKEVEVEVAVIEEPKLVINETPTTLSAVENIPKTLSSAPEENISILTDRTFIPGKDKVIKIQASKEILLASAGIDLSSTLKHALKITPARLSKNDFDSNGIAEVKVNTEENKIFKIIATTEFGEVKSKSLLPQIFVDVPRNHEEVDAITYLKHSGIVKGYEDGTFKPDNNLTRAEAVKILMEANVFSLLSNESSFSDINKNDWYSQYVVTAFENGILKGYPDGTFGPHKKISRAEFLKIAIVAAGIKMPDSKIVSYPDAPLDSWFGKYFQFSKDRKLMLPKKGGFISPHQPITRSEAARVIWMLDN